MKTAMRSRPSKEPRGCYRTGEKWHENTLKKETGKKRERLAKNKKVLEDEDRDRKEIMRKKLKHEKIAIGLPESLRGRQGTKKSYEERGSRET